MIFSLIPSERQRTKLHSAVAELRRSRSASIRLEGCGTWSEVFSHEPSDNMDLLVLDPGVSPEATTVECLRRWSRRSGGAPVILYAPPKVLSPSLVLQGAEEGVAEVIEHGTGSEEEHLMLTLSALLDAGAPEEFLRRCRRGRSLPVEVDRLLRLLLETPLVDDPYDGRLRPRTPDEMATACWMSRSALYRLLRRHDLHPPAELTQRARLFLALRQLLEEGTTVESIALRYGFSSGANFSDAVARRTGLRPTSILSDEAVWDAVLDSLVD